MTTSVVSGPPVDPTWSWREAPILRSALRRQDGGELFPSLEDIRMECGLEVDQMHIAIGALGQAGYLEVSRTMAGPNAVGGHVTRITERTRRELGSWPSATDIVQEMVLALLTAAESEQEPERKTKLRVAADSLGGAAKQIAVSVIAAKLGTSI